MYNVTEVDKILAVESNNYSVRCVKKSKIRYERECKKKDDLLIQYHLMNNIDEEIDFAIEFMEQDIRIFGNKVFDGSMITKNTFALINEELIQKAMSHLIRHLELGGDSEDV